MSHIKTNITKKKGVPVVAKKRARQFGDYRFDFIRGCKHELNAGDKCPFCKLVNLTTRQYFQDLEETRRLAKEQSLLNRAEMRLNLLCNWYRAQSSLYCDLLANHCQDIILSKDLAQSILAQSFFLDDPSAMEVDFDEIARILDRKNRIIEVGHFAAVFLQSRIRKYISRQKTKRLLLDRFEMIPATRRKAEYFIDSEKMKKWTRLPAVLQSERPATPRTIRRRLSTVYRKREERMQRYLIAHGDKDLFLKGKGGNNQNAKGENESDSNKKKNMFEKEASTVRYLKQMVILRDMLLVAKEKLISQIQQAAEEKENEEKPVYAPGSRAARVAEADARAKLAQSIKEPRSEAFDVTSVWFSMTAPTLSPRQLGLAAALLTDPPVLADLAHAPPSSMMAGGGRKASTASILSEPSAKLSTVESVGNLNRQTSSGGGASQPFTSSQLNRALILLEQRAFTALVCETPEEAVKLLLLEDVRPILESINNIAMEPSEVWNSSAVKEIPPPKVVMTDRKTVTRVAKEAEALDSTSTKNSISTSSNSNTPTEDGVMAAQHKVETLSLESFVESDNNEYKEDGKEQKEDKSLSGPQGVLPLSIQLRPYFPSRNQPSGIFRLFFFEEQLVAATQLSPWACFPEIAKNKEAIAATIKLYSEQQDTRTFIHHYYERANDEYRKDQEAKAAAAASIAAADSSPTKGGRRGSVALKRAPPPLGAKAAAEKKAAAAAAAAEAALYDFPPTPEAAPCSSLFIPSQNEIFPPDPVYYIEGVAYPSPPDPVPRQVSNLSDLQIVELVETYSFTKKLSPEFQARVKRAQNNLKKSKTKKNTAAMDAKQKAVQAHLDKIARDEAIQATARAAAHEEENRVAMVEAVGKMKDEVAALRLFSNLEKDGKLLGPRVLNLLRGETLSHQLHHKPAEEDSITVAPAVVTAEKMAAAPAMPLQEEVDDAQGSEPDENTAGEFDGPAAAAAASIKAAINEAKQIADEEALKMKVAVQEMASMTSREYSFCLGKNGAQIDAKFVNRIQKPKGTNIVPEVLQYQLLVLDIYIQLPKPSNRRGANNLTRGNSIIPPTVRASTPSGSRPGTSAGSVSSQDEGNIDILASVAAGQVMRTNSSSDLPSSSLQAARATLLAQPLPVNIHQVVGLVPASVDKAPPHIECGLFDWSFFYEMYNTRAMLRATTTDSTSTGLGGGSSSSSSRASSAVGLLGEGGGADAASFPVKLSATAQAASSRALERERSWGPANPQTGVCSIKVASFGQAANDPSKDWQLLLMEKPAHSSYLTAQLPKKIRDWVGITAALEDDSA